MTGAFLDGLPHAHEPGGLTTDLSAGEVHLKLSRIGKRADIRAWPVRDTVISRWYHGRTIYRKIKANAPPITGSYKTADASGLNVWVHIEHGNPAGLPTGTWLLPADAFSWEAYCPVENDLLPPRV
jgi:hypothetical protein